MSLRIKIDDNHLITTIYNEFNPDESYFLFKNNTEESSDFLAKIKYPLKVFNDYCKDEYSLFLFYQSKFAENDIYQVYESSKDERIGWVFPLQALLSNNHDYAENEHFLKYAYVATEKLLTDMQEDLIEVPLYNEMDEYDLSDFYKVEETIVMIISNNQAQKIESFNIEDYIPYLYSQGYYWDKGNYQRSLIKHEKRISIKSVSPIIKSDDFINQLFNELLINETHPLVKFYLLYQVIELLIEKVFNKELLSILSDIETSSKTLFDIKEDFSTISNEKRRINRLFSVYTNSEGSKTSLKMICNDFLEKGGKESKSQPSEALYSVRNLLVHQYRSISKEHATLLEDINIIFENVIIEVLCELKDMT